MRAGGVFVLVLLLAGCAVEGLFCWEYGRSGFCLDAGRRVPSMPLCSLLDDWGCR